MPGTLTLSTLSDGTNSTSATNCIQGSAKAWVNFNGTTSPGTIRASYNVSSVTKSAAGTYAVNFTTALVDANCAVSACGGDIGGASNAQAKVFCYSTSASSISLYVQDDGGTTLEDHSFVSVSIFR